MTSSDPTPKRQRDPHETKDDAAKQQKQRETPLMQSHDDVRQEEQTQDETPHEDGEGGEDDPYHRRPWESRRESGPGSCTGEGIPPSKKWKNRNQAMT